jgi:hypothetical protein
MENLIDGLITPLLLKTDEVGDICFPPDMPFGQLCFVKTPGQPNKTFMKVADGWDEIKGPERCPHCNQEMPKLFIEQRSSDL